MRTDTVAILLAAGSSTRMRAIDKIWVEVAPAAPDADRGTPLIAYAMRTLATLPEVDAVVVVAPAGQHAKLEALAAGLPAAVRCVEGGARRQDSVAAGLAAAPDAEWYLVHDGARPLVSASLCTRVLAAARMHGAAIPVLPVADTIKRVNALGLVTETLARDLLRAVQTPQAFAGALLRRAHAERARTSGAEATDDAALVEALGAAVATVAGEAANLKVTTPEDLAIVRALLATMRERE